MAKSVTDNKMLVSNPHSKFNYKTFGFKQLMIQLLFRTHLFVYLKLCGSVFVLNIVNNQVAKCCDTKEPNC